MPQPSAQTGNAGEELCFLPATVLRERIARRELSPVEVTRAVLERAERLQPVLNCFITICRDEALRQAQAAERTLLQGEPLRRAARRAFHGERHREHGRRAHHLRLQAIREQRSGRGCGGRGAAAPRRRHPHRKDDHPRVRREKPHRRAALRPHAQCLERGAHERRLERRRRRRGRRRHRAASRSRRMVAGRRAFRPLATASSASSRRMASSRTARRRTPSAITLSSRR